MLRAARFVARATRALNISCSDPSIKGETKEETKLVDLVPIHAFEGLHRPFAIPKAANQ